VQEICSLSNHKHAFAVQAICNLSGCKHAFASIQPNLVILNVPLQGRLVYC
jgi:hypothetical protein